jgi:starch synthase
VPIAHATGGLLDTIDDVAPWGADEGTGWTFAPASAEALGDAVASAVGVYRGEPAKWAAIRGRGMAADWGWGGASEKYERVLLGLKQRRGALAGAYAM